MTHSNVSRRIPLLAAFLFAAVTACGGDESPTDPGGGGGGGGGGGTTPVVTTSVNVSNNAFDPVLIQVSPGATVTWTWTETGTHNVTFTDASITDSGDQSTGTYSTVMPTAASDYAYQCTRHAGMNGTVRVQ